jgi:23S rRNA (pseudouridine1915-N3)-methyltransferase
MRVSIVAVGRLRRGAERDLAARYLERAEQLAGRLGMKLAVREVPQSRKPRPADRCDEEAQGLIAAIPDGAFVIALDERGKALSSTDFANEIGKRRDGGMADIAFVIGGADGLGPTIAARADLVVAFGKLSWPHQLVRAMLLEQIYRALTILTGHPYHRA